MDFDTKVNLADSLYWLFIDTINKIDPKLEDEFIQLADPDDPEAGTENTELGSDLYYAIEEKLDEV